MKVLKADTRLIDHQNVIRSVSRRFNVFQRVSGRFRGPLGGSTGFQVSLTTSSDFIEQKKFWSAILAGIPK